MTPNPGFHDPSAKSKSLATEEGTPYDFPQEGEKGVGLLAGPVGFAQEGEAGFDAGVALEALSEIRKRDSVRHRFAAVPLAQAPHAGCQRDSISTTEPALT